MDIKELRGKMIKMRNAIEDFLDNMDLDEADEGEKKSKDKENKDE
jgi:hypothetical protein